MRTNSAACLITLGLVLVLGAAIDVVDTDASAAGSGRSSLPLNAIRTLPSDLEIGGELTGLPPGETRYVTLDSLLALPLVTYTATDDPNFAGPTKISGIHLEELARSLGAEASADLVIAICDDKYRAAYPRAYIKEHHPLLVLLVNGEPPSRWPKDPEIHRYSMGPYLISHPKFAPSFKILSHTEEPQIPWGWCGSNLAVSGLCLAQSLPAASMPAMLPYRRVTKSRGRIVFAATTQATKAEKKRGVRGSRWRHLRPSCLNRFRPTSATRKRRCDYANAGKCWLR